MMINRQNYEEYFMLYSDEELNVQERKAVEDFILKNPDLRVELEQFRSLKLLPDMELTFAGKASLYRSTGTKKAVPMFKWWYAAAILVFITAGIVINSQRSATPAEETAVNTPARITSKDATPLIAGNTAATPKHDTELNTIPATPAKNIPSLSMQTQNNRKAEPDLKAEPANTIKRTVKQLTEAADINNRKNINNPGERADDAADRPDRPLTLRSISNTASENTEIKITAAAPEKTNAQILNTTIISVPVTQNQVAEVPESYLQSRKNMLKGILHKASCIIGAAAELKNTQQVNVRLGNIEVALH